MQRLKIKRTIARAAMLLMMLLTSATAWADGDFVDNGNGSYTILSCRSSIAIASSISGDGTHAGFVAVQEGGTLTITNCLFDGNSAGSPPNLD